MKSTLLTTFALALTATAFAQPPGGNFQPPVNNLKGYLSLSDSQVQSLQQLLQQNRQALRTTHQEMRQKQTQLRDQLDNGSTDAAALGRLMIDIQSLRRQVGEQRKPVADQARNLLTAEQKTKLQALENASKLRGEIREAAMLGLLSAPDDAFVGPGPAAFGAPGGPAFGGPRGRRRF